MAQELRPPHAPIVHRAPIREGDVLVLDEQAMRGLAFREVNVKEAFTIVDADGVYFRASLKKASTTEGEAVAYERMRRSPESPARITLACAVLGRQRMIQVVQKATEFGCVRVVPVLSDKSVQPKDLDHEKPWAWPGQALKGARQCRRASVPEVLPATPLAKVLDAPWFRDARARFVLDDRAPDEAADPFSISNHDAGDYVLAIGPEGGWSDAERARLAERGAIPLALGGRVLRAETAVFAGLSVLQHRLGDLRAR